MALGNQESPSRGGRLLPYTGLIPVVLVLIPVLAGWWSVAVIVNIVASLAVIVFHLALRQGTTTFDILFLGLGVVNAVLWFGFGNLILLQNFAVTLYLLLATQCLVSLKLGEPWTVQFARRQVDRSLWATPEFIAVNRITTRWWAIGFLTCAALSLLPLPWGLILSTLMLVLTMMRTPKVAARARAQLTDL